MRLCPGAHAMCNDNSKLKTENIGDGTLCHVKRIKMKYGAPQLNWKNWDGLKVYTTSARYIEWVEFERFPDNKKITSKKSDVSALEQELANNQNSSRSSDLEKMKKEPELLKEAQCFKLTPIKSTAFVYITLDDAVSE